MTSNDEKVFPAHAGVIPDTNAKIEKSIRLPRACGGDPEVTKVIFDEFMSSPRMRG